MPGFGTTPAVDFDTIAREWRCKWSPDAEKASLGAAQAALSEILAEVRAPSQVLILVHTPPHLPLGRCS
jgi:hypothetical protein